MNRTATHYEDIRVQIKTGDVLGVRGRGAFPMLTRTAQRLSGLGKLSGITHVGLAWWIDGRLYSVEMDGKHNVLRPLSHHIAGGCAVDVYRCPVPDSMAVHFDRATARPIRYSLPDLIRIGYRLILGGRTGRDDERDMVCSTFAAQWLQWAGWAPPKDFPHMPSPGELCRALGAPSYSIKAMP
jgi:hypothetical protein